jgi:SAM-dependent methyltransferase
MADIFMSIDYKRDYYTKVKPNYAEFDEGIKTYWSLKYNDRWAQILMHLPIEKALEPDLLEVGCGLGRASSYFKRYGAKVLGVEPADYAIAHNRLNANELIHGDFLITDVPGSYDIIYIEQVLSHIPDFREALKKCHSLLRDDGIIAIEEPNDGNPLQMRLAKDKGAYWLSKDHCNYFTFESLSSELEFCGFEPIYRNCTWPMELFELMGVPYLGDEDAGKMVHAMRTEMLDAMGSVLRTRIKESFAEQGLGRDIFLISRKGEIDG